MFCHCSAEYVFLGAAADEEVYISLAVTGRTIMVGGDLMRIAD